MYASVSVPMTRNILASPPHLAFPAQSSFPISLCFRSPGQLHATLREAENDAVQGVCEQDEGGGGGEGEGDEEEEEDCQGESRSVNTVQSNPRSRFRKRKSLFLLDVAPLCYTGKKPTPSSLIYWLRPLLSDVTGKDPIVAVMDGSRGNEYRRGLLSTYKANRNLYAPLSASRIRQTRKGDDADLRDALPLIRNFFQECQIPIASMEDAEADDVVATLAEQAVKMGMRVTIASPDKDFKQLLCEEIQIVTPLSDLQRWSFYTHKQYFSQHKCHPDIELSLRCLLGDKVDGVPGLADLAPGFGRSTALKLLKKYGSLELLLKAASCRTVGKPYIQNALTKHASFLWRNINVLRLRRELPICLKDDWCVARDNSRDGEAFQKLELKLEELRAQRVLQDGISLSNRMAVGIWRSQRFKEQAAEL